MMLKDYWGDIPATPEAREWVRQIMDRAIWTGKEVQSIYGLSQSTVSRLYTKYDWEFAFKKGNQILFLADYAKPWFDQYNAGQNVNRSTDQVQKDNTKKGPGRPKKLKGEYEYELMGTGYKGSEAPLVLQARWRDWLASQWPAYFPGGTWESMDRSLVLEHPPELKQWKKEILEVFNKLNASKL